MMEYGKPYPKWDGCGCGSKQDYWCDDEGADHCDYMPEADCQMPKMKCKVEKECVKTFKCYYKIYKMCIYRMYKVCPHCSFEYDYHRHHGMCPKCRHY